MILYSGLIAALLISSLLTISAVFLGRRGPWGSAWTFFLVLFLALWTVSIYINPVGPVYWGIAWIPLFFAGILLAILLISVMPVGQTLEDNSLEERETRNETTAEVGRFFWVLIILLTIAIIIGMVNPQPAL